MSDTQPTEPLNTGLPEPEQPPAGAPEPPHPGGDTVAQPRAKRRWLRILLWVLIPIVALVALFFVADGIARAYAQDRVASEIEKGFPDTVSGDVSVSIGGASVIQQYLSGSFDRVELDAPKLMVQGAPISASVVATGVPTDFSKPVANLDGTLGVSQDSLNKLVSIPGITGDLKLGDDVVTYDGTADILGLPIGYQVSVSPEAAGKTVLLQPVDAKVTAGSGAIDLSTLVKALTDRGPIPVCVAQYLPEGVQVNEITVTPGHATVQLSAEDFVLDDKTLQSKGSC
ncbi:LmeA family phospholipid-binding protein [Leifsonia poae]|uniref:LmeA family phospholipid-binding protein n=1 Tax=Leifsonia poae TaxID=110933 RepID=UPI003D67CF53